MYKVISVVLPVFTLNLGGKERAPVIDCMHNCARYTQEQVRPKFIIRVLQPHMPRLELGSERSVVFRKDRIATNMRFDHRISPVQVVDLESKVEAAMHTAYASSVAKYNLVGPLIRAPKPGKNNPHERRVEHQGDHGL